MSIPIRRCTQIILGFGNRVQIIVFLLILIYPLGVSTTIVAQNILPDGGFEKLRDQKCLSPEQSFNRLADWYKLDATPDLFDSNCAYEEKNFIFWDAASLPFEGNNFIGIWSRWNSNGTYFTEGIATHLTEHLEAGKTYLLEMAVRNRGGYQGLEVSVAGCELNPNKHIDLYLSHDTIRVVNDFSNGSASTNASLVATLNSEVIQSDKNDSWKLVSTCFQAQGDELFFAIIMPLGTFGKLPECVATMGSSGVFRSFYYQIDGVSLMELPEELNQELNICQDRTIEVELLELFDFSLLKVATFIWDDGFKGNFRRINEIRRYKITAQLECGSILLNLKLTPENCENSIFIPNAFSPNGDGVNDEFLVLISENNTISNFKLMIHDRWGGLLFQSDDPFIGWNGTIGAQEVTAGIYVWSLSYTTREADEIVKTKKRGSIQVLR